VLHKPYMPFIRRQFDGNAFDWDTVDLKATLHTALYVPDLINHDFFSDVNNEFTATGGYTPGGISLAARTVGWDLTTRQIRLLGGAQIQWNELTLNSIRYIVIRNATPVTAATQPLVSLIDFEQNEDVDGILSVAWDATGVGRLVLPA